MSKIIMGGHEITAQKDYSTDEVFTGQYWIDNKPIYKKTYDETVTTYNDGTKLRRFMYKENGWRTTRNLIKAEGVVAVDYNGGVEFYNLGDTIPNLNDGSISITSMCYTHPTDTPLYMFNWNLVSYNATSCRFIITVYYTKTTD